MTLGELKEWAEKNGVSDDTVIMVGDHDGVVRHSMDGLRRRALWSERRDS